MSKTEPTIKIDIYIAGDLEQAKQICRKWTLEVGACVTVEAVSYIYSGGEETGVRVGFINYPRFPTDHETLFNRAADLGHVLMTGLCQLSFSIVSPVRTEWVSRRPE
ncbi:hypothetical protein [Rhizobium sp. BK176]|uniref:hypothetical protein n=1 Tax=Rhizobium sp. BK176 TaxID=2587071 RepID=UPI0021698F43|nr:hypothetical protein [Rhizobium sp. BK176]